MATLSEDRGEDEIRTMLNEIYEPIKGQLFYALYKGRKTVNVTPRPHYVIVTENLEGKLRSIFNEVDEKVQEEVWKGITPPRSLARSEAPDFVCNPNRSDHWEDISWNLWGSVDSTGFKRLYRIASVDPVSLSYSTNARYSHIINIKVETAS